MNSQVIYGKTDQGRRSNNEDAILACTFHGDIHVLAVADGMGGAEGGEIASSLVIKHLSDYFEEHWSINEKNIKEHLRNVFSSAQLKLKNKIAEEPDLKGMGTTLTCLVVYHNYYAWASIGDSRLYKITSEDCRLLTTDHTYQNELLQTDNPEAVNNDYSHILTKVLDGGNDEPDIFPFNETYSNVEKNVLFIVCSDGAITSKSNTDHSWILELANESNDISELAESTIQHALNQGSSDNITLGMLNLDFYIPGKKRNRFIKKKNQRKKQLKTKHMANKWNRRAIILVLMALSFISGWVLGTFPELNPFGTQKQVHELNTSKKEIDKNVSTSESESQTDEVNVNINPADLKPKDVPDLDVSTSNKKQAVNKADIKADNKGDNKEVNIDDNKPENEVRGRTDAINRIEQVKSPPSIKTSNTGTTEQINNGKDIVLSQ